MDIPEIQECLAEHENRISFLENSQQAWTRDDIKEIVSEVLSEILEKPEQWTTKQWDVINQLRGLVTHIHKEHHEKKTTKSKYKSYE